MHDLTFYPYTRYHCLHCGAVGVKLWRITPYVRMNVDLQCGICLLIAWGSEAALNEYGQWTEIGGTFPEQPYEITTWRSFRPAIPKEDGSRYYYASEVPHYLRIWWIGLPLSPTG